MHITQNALPRKAVCMGIVYLKEYNKMMFAPIFFALFCLFGKTCAPATGTIMWAVKPSIQVQCSYFRSDRKDDVTPIYLLIGFFPFTWMCVMWWPGIYLYTVWITPDCLYTCRRNTHIVMKNNLCLCGLLYIIFWDDDHSMSNIWLCLKYKFTKSDRILCISRDLCDHIVVHGLTFKDLSYRPMFIPNLLPTL